VFLNGKQPAGEYFASGAKQNNGQKYP
jgi:hypothetical protein